MIFSWQKEQWQTLWHAKKMQRLPHALLLTGMAGVGKTVFARAFTHALLCQQVTEDGAYCQGKKTCHACRLIAGNAHPNVIWVQPEKTGGAIKIDQVREMIDFISHSAFEDGHKIAVIHPANDLNLNAANALLKTLEEPPANTLIMLVCNQLFQLPATILSRCQRLTFPAPDRGEALSWLQTQLADNTSSPELLLTLANGAPLTALQLVKEDILAARAQLFDTLYSLNLCRSDPVKSAAALQEIELLQLLDFMLSWIMDLMRLQLLEKCSDDVINKDYLAQLMELVNFIPLKPTLRFLEYVQALRAQIEIGFNLNKQLLIETVLIRWVDLRTATCF